MVFAWIQSVHSGVCLLMACWKPKPLGTMPSVLNKSYWVDWLVSGHAPFSEAANCRVFYQTMIHEPLTIPTIPYYKSTVQASQYRGMLCQTIEATVVTVTMLVLRWFEARNPENDWPIRLCFKMPNHQYPGQTLEV